MREKAFFERIKSDPRLGSDGRLAFSVPNVGFVRTLYTQVKTIQCLPRTSSFSLSLSFPPLLAPKSSPTLAPCFPAFRFGSHRVESIRVYISLLSARRNIACAKCKRLHGEASAREHDRPTYVGFIRTVPRHGGNFLATPNVKIATSIIMWIILRSRSRVRLPCGRHASNTIFNK